MPYGPSQAFTRRCRDSLARSRPQRPTPSVAASPSRLRMAGRSIPRPDNARRPVVPAAVPSHDDHAGDGSGPAARSESRGRGECPERAQRPGLRKPPKSGPSRSPDQPAASTPSPSLESCPLTHNCTPWRRFPRGRKRGFRLQAEERCPTEWPPRRAAARTAER